MFEDMRLKKIRSLAASKFFGLDCESARIRETLEFQNTQEEAERRRSQWIGSRNGSPRRRRGGLVLRKGGKFECSGVTDHESCHCLACWRLWNQNLHSDVKMLPACVLGSFSALGCTHLPVFQSGWFHLEYGMAINYWHSFTHCYWDDT